MPRIVSLAASSAALWWIATVLYASSQSARYMYQALSVALAAKPNSLGASWFGDLAPIPPETIAGFSASRCNSGHELAASPEKNRRRNPPRDEQHLASRIFLNRKPHS
jgi:hypothetical protein